MRALSNGAVPAWGHDAHVEHKQTALHLKHHCDFAHYNNLFKPPEKVWQVG